MAAHNSTLSQEALRIKDELTKYFIHSYIECPYGMQYEAIYNQALFNTLPDFLMGIYLASGYRRNGNVIYNMHCAECQACIPIRVDPKEFKTNRNQKRTWDRNQDITVEITPLTCSNENLALLEKFLAVRYPGRDNSAYDYYNGFFLNHITNTVEVSYRIESRLVGISIIDLSTTWLNIVFFYFDPEEGKRSPGTYNILYLIDFCKQKEIKFIYLGYWIKDVKQMNYKANFKPHYILHDDTWQFIDR
jgi:arginyl-tRNA--protein-N-Asp/Glu arginylyltransferase